MATGTPTGRSPKPTSQQMVNKLLADGMTLGEIANECDRSTRMIRLVMNGDRPGNNLLDTLQQLLRGQVRTRPPRRTRKSGLVAKVRGGPGGSVAPPPPKPTTPKRGTFSETTIYMGNRGASYQVSSPKTPGKGRTRASHQVARRIAEAHTNGQRVAMRVHFSDGNSYMIGDKGGYNAATLWSTFGDATQPEPFPWMKDELARIAKVRNSPEPDGEIIGVDVNVFGGGGPPLRTVPGARAFIRDHKRAEQADKKAQIAKATQAHRQAEKKAAAKTRKTKTSTKSTGKTGKTARRRRP